MLSNSPEKQALQEEEIAKTCRKLPKKWGKRLSFPKKQLYKDNLYSSDKSEKLSVHDESDMSMEEDTDPQVFTLDDIIEDDFILTKLCGKEKNSIVLQGF